MIRQAKINDVFHINTIANNVISSSNYYSELAKHEELETFSLKSLNEKLNNDNHLFLISEQDNKVVGFCCGYFDCGTFWVSWVCVDVNYRGKGVASSLFLELETILKKKNIHKIWFDTRVNNVESNKFFERAGYLKVTMLKNHWHGLDYFIWEKFI